MEGRAGVARHCTPPLTPDPRGAEGVSKARGGAQGECLSPDLKCNRGSAWFSLTHARWGRLGVLRSARPAAARQVAGGSAVQLRPVMLLVGRSESESSLVGVAAAVCGWLG